MKSIIGFMILNIIFGIGYANKSRNVYLRNKKSKIKDWIANFVAYIFTASILELGIVLIILGLADIILK